MDQIGVIKAEGLKYVGAFPTVIGETGIPFDMDDRLAYRTHDYTNHVTAMDSTLSAMDATMVNYTIWNYNADNVNSVGDYWYVPVKRDPKEYN